MCLPKPLLFNNRSFKYTFQVAIFTGQQYLMVGYLKYLITDTFINSTSKMVYAYSLICESNNKLLTIIIFKLIIDAQWSKFTREFEQIRILIMLNIHMRASHFTFQMY